MNSEIFLPRLPSAGINSIACATKPPLPCLGSNLTLGVASVNCTHCRSGTQPGSVACTPAVLPASLLEHLKPADGPQNHRNLALPEHADLSLPTGLSWLISANFLPAANFTHALELVSSNFAPKNEGTCGRLLISFEKTVLNVLIFDSHGLQAFEGGELDLSG